MVNGLRKYQWDAWVVALRLSSHGVAAGALSGEAGRGGLVT